MPSYSSLQLQHLSPSHQASRKPSVKIMNVNPASGGRPCLAFLPHVIVYHPFDNVCSRRDFPFLFFFEARMDATGNHYFPQHNKTSSSYFSQTVCTSGRGRKVGKGSWGWGLANCCVLTMMKVGKIPSGKTVFRGVFGVSSS